MSHDNYRSDPNYSKNIVEQVLVNVINKHKRRYIFSYNLNKGKFNINRCSQKSLMKTRQIGKVLSIRIIQNRPYRKMKDLTKLHYIGSVRYNELKKTCYCP